MRTLQVAGFVAFVGLFGQASYAQSGNSVTQSITIEVKPITKIMVSGSPNALVINNAVPGSDLVSALDDQTSYSMMTNLDNMKIVASIDDRMPAGTRLMISLASSKGSSTGVVDLSNALNPVDVVAGIGRGSEQNQAISYIFAADANVGEIPLSTRVVTFTLTN